MSWRHVKLITTAVGNEINHGCTNKSKTLEGENKFISTHVNEIN